MLYVEKGELQLVFFFLIGVDSWDVLGTFFCGREVCTDSEWSSCVTVGTVVSGAFFVCFFGAGEVSKSCVRSLLSTLDYFGGAILG